MERARARARARTRARARARTSLELGLVSRTRPFTDSCPPGRKGLVTRSCTHFWCSWNALISVWDFCLKPDVDRITLRV